MVLRRERVRISVTAATALIVVAGIALTVITRDPWPTNDGIALLVLGSYAGMGYVIARAEPRNPIGWIFLGLGFFTLFDYVNRLYLVLDYREHGGRLPLGGVAVFWPGKLDALSDHLRVAGNRPVPGRPRVARVAEAALRLCGRRGRLHDSRVHGPGHRRRLSATARPSAPASPPTSRRSASACCRSRSESPSCGSTSTRSTG